MAVSLSRTFISGIYIFCAGGLSAALALPAGGFIFGMTIAHGGPNMTFVDRASVGLIYAFLTTISFGFPPKNEGLVGTPYNAWPFVTATGGIIFIILVVTAITLQQISAHQSASQPVTK